MHQPQVARLTTLVLALVVAAPVVCAARTALLAGAFLVEFLTHGRPAALSAVTDLPVRRPFPLGGASADLYVHAGLVPGSPLILVHGLSPEGKDEAGYVVAVDTVSAGFRERVIAVSGSSARMAEGCKDTPVDTAIIGIVDDVAMD